MVRSFRNRFAVRNCFAIASLLGLSSVGVSSVGAPCCRAAEVNPPSPRLTVRGIMRANRVERDLRDAGQGRFLFTARQVSKMRSAVLRRSERLRAGIRSAQR